MGSPFLLKSYLFIWLHWVFVEAYTIFGCSTWDLDLWPGIEPWPLHWEPRVLATGTPGKSQVSVSKTRSWRRRCLRPKGCPECVLLGTLYISVQGLSPVRHLERKVTSKCAWGRAPRASPPVDPACEWLRSRQVPGDPVSGLGGGAAGGRVSAGVRSILRRDICHDPCPAAPAPRAPHHPVLISHHQPCPAPLPGVQRPQRLSSVTSLAHRPRQRSPRCPDGLDRPAVSGAAGRGVQGRRGHMYWINWILFFFQSLDPCIC